MNKQNKKDRQLTKGLKYQISALRKARYVSQESSWNSRGVFQY